MYPGTSSRVFLFPRFRRNFELLRHLRAAVPDPNEVTTGLPTLFTVKLPEFAIRALFSVSAFLPPLLLGSFPRSWIITFFAYTHLLLF